MKANQLLKENIATLLRARQQTQRDLAGWCRRGESWLSQIFTNPEREIPLKYLDRIADFFGLTTYQLFQPGISHLTERRTSGERRTGRDRRIGRSVHAQAQTALGPTLTADEIYLLKRLRQLKHEHWQHVSRWIDATLLAQGIAPDTTLRRDRPDKGQSSPDPAAGNRAAKKP